MTQNSIIDKLLVALHKIAETDKPMEATSQNDWRRRAKIIASNAIKQARNDLREQKKEADNG